MLCSVLSAQHYTPFLLNNSKWVVQVDSPCCQNACGPYNIVTYYYYQPTTDTQINNLTYKTLLRRYDNFYFGCTGGSYSVAGGPYSLYGYLREDTLAKKIYFLYPTSASDSLLYNFNLGLNDTVNDYRYGKMFVDLIDSFTSNGIGHRRLRFHGPDFNYGLWIEGLGSTVGLFNPFNQPLNRINLNCFSTSGQTIYPAYNDSVCQDFPLLLSVNEIEESSQLSLHPNPVSSICTLQLNTPSICSGLITDVTGREVMPLFNKQLLSTFSFDVSVLPGGLYFLELVDSKGQVTVSKLVKE
ncbi:MAG: hypothetical protein JWO06_1563 [Bacteroidota bacterium]|nr:hypothetical protein [Bacteroidota bacterium]